MTEPRDERSAPGRAAEADDPVWLAARLAEAQDQLGATSEILSILARASTSEDDVFEAVVEYARRLCRAQAAQIAIGTATRTGSWPREGLNREYARVRGPEPGTAQPRHAHRTRGARPPDPADRRRPGRPRLQPARVPTAGRLPVDHRGADARRRRGGRRPHGVAHHGRAVRRAHPHPADRPSRSRRRSRCATSSSSAALQARSAELARKVDEMEALAEVGEAISSTLDPDEVLATIVEHAVELSGRRRRVAHGVRRGEPAVPRAHDLRHERRRPRAAARRFASTSTSRSSGGRRPRGCRCRCPTCPRSSSTRTCACCSTAAGARSW